MLSKKEMDIVKEYAAKYRVSSVILFGSSIGTSAANDIDLAIKGIKPGLFFSFYADLFKHLSKRVDLVDLEDADDYLMKRILEGGKVIYEA